MLLPYQEIIAILERSDGEPEAIAALEEEYKDKSRPWLLKDERSQTIAIVCTPELYAVINSLLSQSQSDDSNTMMLMLRAYKQLKPLINDLNLGKEGG